MSEKTTDKIEIQPSIKLQVRVSDFENGLRVFNDINFVRIISENYNLLIMDDFIPTVGIVKGVVEIVGDSDITTIKDIDGYYMHRNNVFTLLIDEEKREKN